MRLVWSVFPLSDHPKDQKGEYSTTAVFEVFAPDCCSSRKHPKVGVKRLWHSCSFVKRTALVLLFISSPPPPPNFMATSSLRSQRPSDLSPKSHTAIETRALNFAAFLSQAQRSRLLFFSRPTRYSTELTFPACGFQRP